MSLDIGHHVRKRPFALDIGVVRCRTAQSDEASASTLLREVEFRDCERSGEDAFGAHRNPRLMLGCLVGGVRLSVGVGGGDLEAVVFAEAP